MYRSLAQIVAGTGGNGFPTGTLGGGCAFSLHSRLALVHYFVPYCRYIRVTAACMWDLGHDNDS